MIDTLQQLAGTELAGQYRLQELLGDDERGAFFQTSYRGRRALIQVMRAPLAEFWQRAAQLNHPHVQRVLDSGSARGFAYVVFEYPEDRLSAAMPNGLTRKEAREVVSSLRDALAYLHAHGFAHGAVTPDHIVAVGETIKLESDTLHEASAAKQAEDLRGLKRLAAELGVTRRHWWIIAASVVTVTAVVALTRHSSQTPPPQPPPVTYVSHPTPVAAPVPPHYAGNWRVIAYTYSRFQDAAKKAERINQKHPEFHAEVYTPNGRNRGPYLVALGGAVTRAEAERLQKKAKAQGLPRDTFARNYSQ